MDKTKALIMKIRREQEFAEKQKNTSDFGGIDKSYLIGYVHGLDYAEKLVKESDNKHNPRRLKVRKGDLL